MTAAERSILVVEDEKTLAETLSFNLQRQGFDVWLEYDGYAAIRRVSERAPDLIILDVMLPGLDGFEVCRRIRSRSRVPILMLTARGEEVDRIVGLEIGADDYLTKPFSLRELQARVRALLRRSTYMDPNQQVVLESSDIRLSETERRAWKGARELRLRPREYALLAMMLRNRGIALTRPQILAGAWDDEFAGDERTVDVHVRSLREAIEDDPVKPRMIVTVRGVGYRFDG